MDLFSCFLNSEKIENSAGGGVKEPGYGPTLEHSLY